MINKIKQFIKKRKIMSVLIVLLMIFGIYLGIKTLKGNTAVVNYVLAAAEKGTIITSISGSGQVSAMNQVDIKSKASGDVVYIGVKAGQKVKPGTLLVQIDTRNAQKSVQDAEIGLETAQIQLEELLAPPDELTLLQAENSLVKAKESKQKAEDNIISGYEDAFNSIANAFFDLPTIITDLGNVLYSYEIANSQKTLSGYWNISALLNSIDGGNGDYRYELERFIKSAENDYKIARTKYDENLKNYKSTSRYSEYDIIEALLEETLDTARAMAETVRSEINMLDFWADYRSRRSLPVFSNVTGYQADLKSYTSKTNSLISSLLNIQGSFKDDRQTVLDAEYSIKEKEISLKKIMAGSDDLDIRSKKITIQQKEDALITARENLAGCYVRAPFDGIVAEISVKKGDSVSSGTKLLTFVSEQKIAEITLNEIDAVKVKTDQKTTITFDAIEDLTITGEVVEVDTMGTVSQGVVSYNVKILFDTQDERVKPGMSLSVAIITDVKQNVLLVPNSAIKSSGDISYVEMPNEKITLDTATTNSGVILATVPGQQQVEIGLVNDSYTEIISGLNEGDEIIIKTNNSSVTTTTTQPQNSFRIPGAGGGGGMFRGD
ncbi:MAG: efflux RND transporter periplasmic adaptor subunit [Patescibacteria group bacterium]